MLFIHVVSVLVSVAAICYGIEDSLQNATTQMLSMPLQNATTQMLSMPLQNVTTQMLSMPLQNATTQMLSMPLQNVTTQMLSMPLQNATTQMLSMPLQNDINAPIVARIDVSSVNKELKAFIQQEVQNGIKTAMTNLADDIFKKKLDAITPQLEANLQQKLEQAKTDLQDNIGTTYIQWGRSSCTADDTDIVYSGFVGGSWYNNSGAAVNHLCLTNDPQWGIYDSKVNQQPFIGGALFHDWDIRVPNSPFDFHKYDHHQVACSVCMKRMRVSTIMIPARNDCYGDWVKEYNGYLFAGHPTHAAASEYICMDETPDVLNKSSTWTGKKLLYHVIANCNGAIPCPPYVNGGEATCVVCTR